MLVFVYGTLRENCRNHYWLEGAEKVGVETIKENFKMIDTKCGYPTLIVSKEKNPIVGEIYKIDDQILKKLDYFEGYPVNFNRKLIKTNYGDAIVYFRENFNYEFFLIESGDWIEYNKKLRNGSY